MYSAICIICGTQFPPADTAPASCPICEDDRQYVLPEGQKWSSLEEMQASGHRNVIIEIAPDLFTIRTSPAFAIGQHAQLIRTPHGNILWDSISYIDDETVEKVRELGGISAIAISHPHFYSSMLEWSRSFGAPIYLHAANQPWVMNPDEAVHFWEGDQYQIIDGITIIRCGGHFPGSSVLHWAAGAEGKGAIFTGDTINVVSDLRYVSFMYSYPNQIPLNASTVRKIVSAVEPFAFDRIYGSWEGKIVATDGHAAVRRSAERYIQHISE